MLSLLIKRNEAAGLVESINVAYAQSRVSWHGEVVPSDKSAYNRIHEGTVRRFVYVLINHKFGKCCCCAHLSHVLDRLANKKGNSNLQNLFGKKSDGVSRINDLFIRGIGDAIYLSEKVLPRESLTFEICVEGSEERGTATDVALEIIRNGINAATGDFVPQVFSGPLTCRQSRELVVDDKRVVKQVHESVPAEDHAAEFIFRNVIEEIERILNRRPQLGTFISNSTVGFVESASGVWKVSFNVRRRRFRLEQILEGIVQRLDEFSGEISDWKGLQEVAGGLAVLGIDREWIAKQRIAARTAKAEFPSHDELIGVGEGRQANLLHLITCAIADGRARLEKLFGKPPVDDRRIPDVALVNMGHMLVDVEKELKLFFIRNIIGPFEHIDPSDDNRITVQFDQVKRMLRAAFHKSHNPYYGSGRGYIRLSQLIRTNLRVEDLLLIFPSGDDPELLISDNICVLQFLGRIFDAAQVHSPGFSRQLQNDNGNKRFP